MKFKYYITLLFLLCNHAYVSAQCEHPDYEELMLFYHSTDGDNWANNSGWKEGAEGTSCDPCADHWNGIVCWQQRVVSIELTNNGLRGELKNINLENLWALWLINNNLEGTIPDFNTNPKLLDLRLGGNNLEGSIPSFKNHPLLNNLGLSGNNLTGPIPSFENCPELVVLDLSFNNLNDTIPSFDKLIALEELNIDEAGLFGKVPSFSSNQELKYISLHRNNLTGSVKHLEYLPRLITIIMSENKLTGCLPIIENDPILNLNLVFFEENVEMPFFGDYNLFVGNDYENLSAPCSIYDIPGAVGLIDENCDCVPQVCNDPHPDLQELIKIYDATNGQDWTNNSGWIAAKAGYRCDPCDDFFGNFYGVSCDENNNIVCIDLDGAETCNFNGFGGNNLMGEWPKVDLQYLELLILDDNNLEGDVPDVSLMRRLKELRVSNNKMTGSVPDFTESYDLETVRLGFNNLSGHLPESMNAPRLKFMTVTDNNLSGCFESWVCKLELFEASGNDDLAWYGNRTEYCEGVAQFLAPCGDSTLNYGILNDCTCGDLSTSIDKSSGITVKMYPNPTYSVLNFDSDAHGFHANIYNMQGKRTKSQSITEIQLDVSDLENGIYLIEIISNDSSRTLKKFVKL